MKAPLALTLSLFLSLGSVSGVVNQMRPPVQSDFGGGGLQSPIYVNGVTGECFVYVNGTITPISSSMNVKSFGAKGNGTTDDTDAIQTAVTAAGNVTGGGALFFPPGQYKITRQINILRSCHIFGRPYTANIYMGAPNINGFVVGDGSAATNIVASSTYITGLQFAVLSGVPQSTSGSAIVLNNVNFCFVTNVSISGKSTLTQLWNGIEILNSLEWTIDRPLIRDVRNMGMRVVGIVSATCGDGRIESPECTGCGTSSGAAAIYFGDYTGAITVDSCIMDSNFGWGIEVDCTQAAGVGANYFIMFPDIEASTPTNPPGSIYVKQGTAQIVGGWMGGTGGLQVDALGSSVTMNGVIVQSNFGAIVSGPACAFTDCDFAGPASASGPTGILLNVGATDTNITGGHIRQWNTEGVKFSGGPVRCQISNVNFRSNGTDITAITTDINSGVAPKGATAPTPTSGTGTFTSATAAITWTKQNDRVQIDAVVTITTNGTAATDVRVPLPFTPAASAAGAGFQQTTGGALSAIFTTTLGLIIRNTDGTYPGADGRTLIVSGAYRV